MAIAPTRQAGLALVVGVILAMVGSMIFPGGPIVESVDQTDFQAAIGALAGNPGLGHITTLMVIVGMILHGYGLLALFGLARGSDGLSGHGLRFGIILSLFGWGVFILAMAKRLMVIHLTQRADIAETAELAAFFDTAAITGHTEMAGLTLGFIALYPFGSALTGLGLISRFEGTDLLRLACYGLVVVGVLGFVNFVIALFTPDANVETLLIVNNLVLAFGSACLLILGIGMYQGRSEVTAGAGA